MQMDTDFPSPVTELNYAVLTKEGIPARFTDFLILNIHQDLQSSPEVIRKANTVQTSESFA
jgi:hypothetical protein